MYILLAKSKAPCCHRGFSILVRQLVKQTNSLTVMDVSATSVNPCTSNEQLTNGALTGPDWTLAVQKFLK
jgi:hypothetical protein